MGQDGKEAEMLNAFKEQLKRLAADPKDQFASRVRRLAGGRAAPALGLALRRLILSMPAMARQIRGWTDDTNMPQGLLRQQKFALAYLYSPVDFLPETEYGLFGYLDDAFLVGQVYESTHLELKALGISAEKPGEPMLPEIADGLVAARKILPSETGAIQKLLSEVESGAGHERALALAAELGRGALRS